MINLLLPVNRRAIRAEYRHRLFVVGGLLAFGLALIALIIISSFVFILSLRRDEIFGQVAAARRQFSTDELVKARQAVEQTNATIKILAASGPESVAAILRRLIDRRIPGIQLTSFAFSVEGDGRVEVKGQSQTRATLLAYLETLRADPSFFKIESPVRNIIRERDVAFGLTIIMAPSK